MNILDYIFPKRCVICKKQESYLCDICFSYLSFDYSRKKYLNASFDQCFCALTNNRVSQRLVNVFKNKPFILDLGDILGELFYESLIQNEGFMKEIDKKDWVLTFIPLTSEKLRKRGYNQAEILAKYLAKKFKKEVENIENIKKGNVFLVDDYIKTGETIEEATRFLKKNGVSKVIALALVRK